MTPTSKRRPVDWQPLGDSDPVPGDPEEIRSEVKHMVSVARKLRDQAKNLKAISDEDTLKGKYVKRLREESGTLEKHMREVAGRYERVHGHLTKWSNELEDFQSDADKVLQQAKEKQGEIEAEEKKEADSADKDTPALRRRHRTRPPTVVPEPAERHHRRPGHPRQPPCREDPRRDRRRDRGLVVGRRQGLGP